MKLNVDLTDNRDFRNNSGFELNANIGIRAAESANLIITGLNTITRYITHNTGDIILTGNASERLLLAEVKKFDMGYYVCDCCSETVPWRFMNCETLCDKCNSELEERYNIPWWRIKRKADSVSISRNIIPNISVATTTLSNWSLLNEDEIMLNIANNDSDL